MTVFGTRLVGSCLLAFSLTLALSTAVRGHEEFSPVIVDTDMALDDVRALALILGSGKARIKAMVTSDGSSSAKAGYDNLLRVLDFLEIREFSTGMGEASIHPPPPWREQSEALGWANLPPAAPTAPTPDAVSVIAGALLGAEEKVTYVCLGPLTNLAAVLDKDPAARDRIQNIFYSGAPPGEADPGWNTVRDPEAARTVFSSGLPIYAVNLEEAELLSFDADLYESIRNLDSRAARLVELVHRDERIQKRLREGHFRTWDEATVLLLIDSSLGHPRPLEESPAVRVLSEWDRDAAREDYIEVLSAGEPGALGRRIPVVLRQYPTRPKDFRPDIAPLIERIVSSHGLEEWKATFLTNELHRHLGIYSLLGAKMGIRARELLGASLDEVEVESHAGLEPPLSCLNDGLQVATGASLGRGTITVLTEEREAAATFRHREKVLHLRLKKDLLEKVRKDIRTAARRFGSMTPEYSQEVRRLALEYWVVVDRKKVFEETWEPRR